jgi:hypothetical protein
MNIKKKKKLIYVIISSGGFLLTFFFTLTELLLALGRDNDLVSRYNSPILLKYFRADIHIKGGKKDPSLSFFHSHRRDVLFELFNSCDDVADGLLLALFKSA